MNISELARQLKTEPQILKEKLPELGIHIGEKAIQIDDALIDKAEHAWHLYQKQEQLKAKIAKRKQEMETEHNDSEKETITLPLSITVSNLAKKLNLDVGKVIVKLIKEGVMAAMHQKIEYETASIIAEDFGFKTKLGSDEIEEEKEENLLKKILSKETHLENRPPIVVIMGHVDHGKTTLLDSIRKTNVADVESGSITQHIGAYQITVQETTQYQGKSITFIDTPGHEAFWGMRSRGGRVADIAILVIAADDKIQPQTLEAIEIIQKEHLGLIVAINKIDKPGADVDRIKKELASINLVPEDWGGEIICVPISAKKGQNLNELLENTLLLAEIEELKANPQGELYSTVIESRIDKGLGPVATVIIQNGTLRVGDIVSCFNTGGRVKSLLDFKGALTLSAAPSTPVTVLGLKNIPHIGTILTKAESIKEIKKLSKNYRLHTHKAETKTNAKTQTKTIKIFLKTDVAGILEALVHEIAKITDEDANIKIIKQGLGNFTESDALEAEAEGAILLGFKVNAATDALKFIANHGIAYKTYSVIYELLNDLKENLQNILPTKIIEEELGEAQILAIFSKTPLYLIIGGCAKTGKITKNSKFRIFRNNEVMGEGIIAELQSNKIAKQEIHTPQEFGAKIRGDLNIKIGDVLHLYITKEEKRTL